MRLQLGYEYFYQYCEYQSLITNHLLWNMGRKREPFGYRRRVEVHLRSSKDTCRATLTRAHRVDETQSSYSNYSYTSLCICIDRSVR